MSDDKALATEPATQLPAISEPRLPYHPAIEERFGIDKASWRALVESTFPTASSVDSVILALSYCKARNLDPFKRVVHIVPIWDKQRKRLVDTVWPGIAEYRTTAFRTGSYAGKDQTEVGPTKCEKVGGHELTYPEWMLLTVYRLMGGQRIAFPGPRVHWLETFGAKKDGSPNSMWSQRPFGMLEKCAEAASLRCAFPEELGGEPIADEVGGFMWHGRAAIPAAIPVASGLTPKPSETIEATHEPNVATDGEIPLEPEAKEESPAESTPDLPDLPDQSPLLAEYMMDIGKASAAKSVIDAKKILGKATDDDKLSADSLWEIRRWGEECIGGINSTRGERSNQPKGE